MGGCAGPPPRSIDRRPHELLIEWAAPGPIDPSSSTASARVDQLVDPIGGVACAASSLTIDPGCGEAAPVREAL